MRIATVAITAAALSLGACASTPSGPNHYQTELQRLTADCTARDGILSPTGEQSGRPQLDNVCKITSVRSDRLRQVS